MGNLIRISLKFMIFVEKKRLSDSFVFCTTWTPYEYFLKIKFQNSTITTYKTMWSYMDSNPGVFVQTYEQGIKRVLQGNYAFLIESPMLDYAVQRDCNLTQIGTKFI